MNAVERLGSYIGRGVYTVSGPFHPFGGAVDIIVVVQPDGSYKSSPWYIRFGKFQGVLKAKEKVVNISVNGDEGDLHMYLDQRGEAYFMRDVEGEEGESVLSPLSSGDETDAKSPQSRRLMKSTICNYDSSESILNDETDESNGKIMARTASRRAKLLGLVFGRRSLKERSFRDEDDGPSMGRATSMERAEIAANLLEVKWSTNLATSKPRRSRASQISASNSLAEAAKAVADRTKLARDTGAGNVDMGESFEAGAGIPSFVGDEQVGESSSSVDDIEDSLSERSRNILEVAALDSPTVETLWSMDELVPVETVVHQDEHIASNETLTKEPILLVGKDLKNMHDSSIDDFESSLHSDGSEQYVGDQVLIKGASVPLSESSEEEQFPFSDPDESKQGGIEEVSSFQCGADKENNPSFESRKGDGLADENNTTSADAETFPLSNIDADNDCKLLKPKVKKKLTRAITPTSEQVASLNLKEGKNTVTFTFSTKMLGKQLVDARIFLWKWNTQIVISDVDGTITKSDVLGQFMPLVGVNWSQTGVTQLFSAIEENGYQLMFLSARAISQAYITRQFLSNLKQNGKALPDGPVVISPDGLFPSLFREVIRRVPHEFKIACLETIKGLFPSDANPFYAGFGNRDTDEISYLKVGIPRGKIFIINPKGEVAVHRRVDTKSYTSLHSLVHNMFPSMKSSGQEDFNSWNFWKLPPVLIDN